MYKNLITFFLLVFMFMRLEAQNASEPPVHHRPNSFVISKSQFVENVKDNWRRRNSPVPEQKWRATLATSATTKMSIFNGDRVLVPCFDQKAYHIDLKTGLKMKSISSTGGVCIHLSVEGVKLGAFNTNGRFFDFRIGKGSIDSRDGYIQKGILDAMHIGDAGYVTRYNMSPVKYDMTKLEAEELPDEALSAPVTATLAKVGPDFWLGLFDGNLVNYTKDLVKKPGGFKLKESYATSIAGDYTYLVVTTANKEIIVFNRGSGLEVWRKKLEGLCFNKLVIDAGRLLVGAQNFYVLDIKDGNTIFEHVNISFEGFGRVEPVVADDRIYVCDRNGYLHIFDNKTYKFYQAINLDEEVLTDFIYYDKQIIICTVMANVYCLDVSLY